MKQAKKSNARRDEKTPVVPRLDCLDLPERVVFSVVVFFGGGCDVDLFYILKGVKCESSTKSDAA